MSLFSEFLRAPAAVASVTPSSDFLGDAMIAPVDFTQPRRLIVELGPGTGPVTRRILQRMRPDGLLLAFERNPALAAQLRADLPDARLIVVEADAIDIARQVTALGFTDCVDAVVSTLPLFGTFPAAVADQIVDGVADVLRACDGVFTQVKYATTFTGRDPTPALKRRFQSVTRTYEPLNVPPAYVYAARGVK